MSKIMRNGREIYRLTGPMPTISLSKNRLLFFFEGGSDTVDVNVDYPWTATTNMEGITLAQSGNVLTVTSTITALTEGTITITSDNEYNIISAEISVNVVKDFASQYFSMVSLEDDNNVGVYFNGVQLFGDDAYIAWSKDLVNWTTYTNSNLPSRILVPAEEGEIVYWKGYVDYYSNSDSYQANFYAEKSFYVQGNIMSLLNGDDFITNSEFREGSNGFRNLFRGSTTLVSAENLVLPATVLCNRAYCDMFNSCTNLVNTPVFPHAYLPYNVMFNYPMAGVFRDCPNIDYVEMYVYTDSVVFDYPFTYFISGNEKNGTLIIDDTQEQTYGHSYISYPSGWTIETKVND